MVIYRELDDNKGQALCLANQAELLAEKMVQPQEALPLAEEAYRIATENGLTDLVEQIKPILESIRRECT